MFRYLTSSSTALQDIHRFMWSSACVPSTCSSVSLHGVADDSWRLFWSRGTCAGDSGSNSQSMFVSSESDGTCITSSSVEDMMYCSAEDDKASVPLTTDGSPGGEHWCCALELASAFNDFRWHEMDDVGRTIAIGRMSAGGRAVCAHFLQCGNSVNVVGCMPAANALSVKILTVCAGFEVFSTRVTVCS